MITKCISCGLEIVQSSKHRKKYCNECMKKRRVMQVMKSRKKKNPNIEIGVGSGNYYKNKHQPLGIQTYRKARKEMCEWCGSQKNLLVHHKDENRYNNNLDNLITLCKSCNQKLHTKRNAKTGRYEPK